MEDEIDSARVLSEIMLIFYMGSYSLEKNGITFESAKNAFSLLSQISSEHVHNLDMIADRLIDFYNDMKSEQNLHC